MPGEVPYQIITRAARRRADAVIGHSTGDNAPTANVQHVIVVVPAPRPATTARAASNPAQLVAPGSARRPRTQAGSGRAPRRRRGLFGTRRRARRTPAKPQAVNDDPDATAGVEDKQQAIERDSVENDDQLDQWPQIFNNPVQAQGEDANDDQDQDEPIEDQPEDDQEEEEEDPSEPDEPPPRDRCTSPLCPVPTNIPHDRGLYLHDGQPNLRLRRYQFGISNPPPAAWIMFDRMLTNAEQREDREAFNAFVRNHAFQADPFWGPADGELVTVV